MLEPLIDTKLAAEYLGFKPNVLEQWRVQGRGPRFLKIGRAVKYAPADLRAYVEASASNSTSQAA